MAEHLGVLVLIVGLCLFIAFIVWIIVFMQFNEVNKATSQLVINEAVDITEKVAEDGGEIYIVRDGYTRTHQQPSDAGGILKPRRRFSWQQTN
jgi:hypothetical protein